MLLVNLNVLTLGSLCLAIGERKAKIIIKMMNKNVIPLVPNIMNRVSLQCPVEQVISRGKHFTGWSALNCH